MKYNKNEESAEKIFLFLRRNEILTNSSKNGSLPAFQSYLIISVIIYISFKLSTVKPFDYSEFI